MHHRPTRHAHDTHSTISYVPPGDGEAELLIDTPSAILARAGNSGCPQCFRPGCTPAVARPRAVVEPPTSPEATVCHLCSMPLFFHAPAPVVWSNLFLATC